MVSLVAGIWGEGAPHRAGGKGLGARASVGAKQGEDLRTSHRREYPYFQMIAPIQGNLPPSPDEFFPVQCKDLSCGGISVYLSRRPDFEKLVVCLGPAPALSLTAQIVHVQPVEVEGLRLYLAGCRFTGRNES